MKNTFFKTFLFFLILSASLSAGMWLSVHAESSKEPSPYFLEFPLGLDSDVYLIPEENPLTVEKVNLGKMLFFDNRLSVDSSVSCATCHDPQKGYTDQKPVSSGVQSLAGSRNSPTILNSNYHYFQFWDGREKTLEDQAKGPIENPVEMAHTLQGAAQRISKIKGYAPFFEAAFGNSEVTIEKIVQAIASFERTLLSGNSAWDRYIYNRDENALSESAKRGLTLFEGKARCTQCHLGFNLTDGLFHNIGVGMDRDNPDLGRYAVTNEETDKGAFKTPGLRDLLRTAPYMHDGSMETLEEVIEFYDKGGEANPWLDEKMEPLNLSEQDEKDLLAFLKSLEGDWIPVEKPWLPED